MSVDVERTGEVVADPAMNYEWYEARGRGASLPQPPFQVLGEHTQGGLAEYCVVPADNLLEVPDNVPFETAAAAAAIAIAKLSGARVYAVISGPANVDRVRALGADVVYDRLEAREHVCMANEQKIDLAEAFDRVLEKYRSRDGDRWARKGG